ncbi:guanine nucleotide exchange factor DBS-like isoform X2 [Babylonia areolata]|uniref:guanine nucleotide exchange factor DBS-like isoform X2 n=1 Tax=Babylonia areolata TaxID=304850 RepID=UPI003FD3AC03
MLSSPDSEDPRGSSSTCSTGHNPLFVHRKIEDDIEHFVENFKQKSSLLDRRPSSDSGDSSGWTSSVFSATDTPSTDSPDRDGGGELLPLPEEDVQGRNGIIAESRRIAQWALRQSRYTTSRDACQCSYHPKAGDAMGETKVQYKVLDVAELLQSRFVILTGGKAKNGAPILTFPDRQGAPEVTDEDYRKVVTYVCDLVPLHEAESGFVVVIDRRQDGWGAVRSILLKMSMFFPNHVQVVFLLQPKGFFQRAFADFRSKFLKEELEFKVVLCDSPEEMLEHIETDQLTQDLGGQLLFDTNEWTQHRSAVEKFAQNAESMSSSFCKAVKRFEELELPNAVGETEAMVRCCMAERKELLDDYGSFTAHGATLLGCIRGDAELTPLGNLCHVLELERLLVQLEETKGQFDQFWSLQETRMRQGLHLRQFEEDFKLIQFGLGVRIEQLEERMGDFGSSVAQVQTMTAEFEKMEEESQKDLEQAERMRGRGQQLMTEDGYAEDSIRPKCLELQRMCEHHKDLLRRRRQLLAKSHDLHDRLDRANRWCSRGVDLLANQPMDKCQTAQGAEEALGEINDFLKSSKDLKLSNPREFRNLFEEIMTPESRGTVQQVLKRMEDVQAMCEKRKESLQKVCGPRVRPVQPVTPAPAAQSAPPAKLHPQDEIDSSSSDLKRKPTEEPMKKSPVFLEKSARLRPDSRVAVVNHGVSGSGVSGDSTAAPPSSSSSSSSSVGSGPDTLQAKRRHVMTELIDTEETYVTELQEILQGYYKEMDNREVQHMIPQELTGQKHVLFGNLEQIFKFHNEIFLQELQDCRDYPAKVGRCFVNRKEEFQMYSMYCQNKPKSEALRMRVGDSNPFFKQCQRRLGHKLPLGAYLLKPVQRITKYQLLLKEMLRFTGEDAQLEVQLQEAVSTMLSVLQYLNASMHQVHIVGYQENLLDLGRLLMHGGFSVWTEHKRERIKDLRFKAMQRQIFLYERGLLLCKKKEESDRVIYAFKNKLKLSQVGLTEKLKGDKRRFELWSRGREEVFIIQAPSLQVKDVWVAEIKRVLMSQFDQIKSHKKTYIPLTQDEPSFISPISSDSSDYSLDNWRGGGGGGGSGMSTSAIVTGTASTTTTTTITSPHNNNNSTLPLGLEMISPVSPQSADSFPPSLMTQSLPPYYSGGGGTQQEEVVEEEEEEGEEEEGGWSSGEFSNEEENLQESSSPSFEPSFRQQFVSLGDYQAVDSSELGLGEGDVVEVLRVGNHGWWYACHLTTGAEGWVPSTYLEPAPPQQHQHQHQHHHHHQQSSLVHSSSGMNV